jgi:uncharacterized protein (DUF2062 family)
MQRRVVDPLLQLLRVGATPRQLAWSIAIGIVVGINPLLGSTTVLALAAAGIFRLNIVASQLGNHVMYPFELLLFPVFIRLGIRLFHTPPLPFEGKALFHMFRHHTWATTRLLWRWEWHALVLWAVFAAATAPLLALMLRRPLELMLARLHKAEPQQCGGQTP